MDGPARLGTRDAQTRAVAPRTSQMVRVGALDDHAEAEADRIAESSVAALRDRRPGLTAAGTPAPSRIRRAPDAAPTIRRSIYLFNEDDAIYKDTEFDDLELAFISKVGNGSIFVEYSAVERLSNSTALRSLKARYIQSVVAKTMPKKPLVKPGDLGVQPTNHKQQQNEKVKKGMNKLRAKAQHLQSMDRAVDLRSDVRDSVRNDTAEGRQFVQDLGQVYFYDRDDGELTHADLDANFLSIVVCDALYGGPRQLRTGGGSRLPAPVGLLWVAGAGNLDRDQVLQVIGVDVADLPKYRRVGIRHVDWGAYQRHVDETADANKYVFASNDNSIQALYVSYVETARASNSRVQVDGVAYADDAFLATDPNSDAGQKMTAAYGTLGTVTADSGWITGTHLTARGRGKGQTSAMKGWNALGAAAYANTFLAKQYDLAQNWEWLHIRGAQLGGFTDGTNLVAGLYTTNSAMIPFEAMIERWARAGPAAFQARFLAHGIVGSFCTQIELQIRANDHPELGTLDAHSLATFDPLTGSVVDKLGAEMIKRLIDRNVHG